MLFVFIDVFWCPTLILYHMMFVSFNSFITGTTSGAGTIRPYGSHEFTPGIRLVLVV